MIWRKRESGLLPAPLYAGVRLTSVGVLLGLLGSDAFCAWAPVPGHIMTEWAGKVDPENPLPKYPRPQLVRKHWVNLNGLWDYAVTGKDDAKPARFHGRILVPFCIESALSGVKRKFTRDDRLWYSRTFTAPSLAEGERLILNFGAVDYEATVLVNGKKVGTHRGGYDAFSFDITRCLKPGENALVVSVVDATGSGPRGKQRVSSFDKPGFIFYTAASGIWQTVWLEKVPATYITSLRITPDIDSGTVAVTVNASGGTAEVAALDGGRKVAGEKGRAGEPIVLRVRDAKLWSPESPFLYDLRVSLGDDEVTSYFGMRKISVGKDGKGVLRPMLNNKPVYMAGPLDQGYWPDGIYTAPTDEALRYDLVMTKRLGFNMTRKHVKVEPARWFYWTDKLGLLVWQDMPNGSAGKDARGFRDGVPRSKAAADQFEHELRAMVQQHYNHPSVVWWIVFNEAWGQYDTPRLTGMVKELDPTRIVCGASGWFSPPGCGDVIDRHRYPLPPGPSPEGKRVAVAGEFGGVGYAVPGHLWVPGQTESSVYQTAVDKRHYEYQYLEVWKKAFELDVKSGTSAAVYTQITDVETEVNGLMTYDRKVVKGDLALFSRAAGKREFPPKPDVTMLLPTSEKTAQEWSYTCERPADGWYKPGADLSGWKRGPGLFGHKVHRNGAISVNTEWTSFDLWIARSFKLPAEKLKRPVLRVAYDDNATVYINGAKAFEFKGGRNRPYRYVPLPSGIAARLKAGRNTIAIHVDNRKGKGSQFIDAGLGEESITW